MRDVIHCLRGTDFCPSHPFRGTIWGQNYEKNMKTGRKYGEKEKMQILIKSLIFRTLQIYIFSFYAFLFFVSLAFTLLCALIPEFLGISSEETGISSEEIGFSSEEIRINSDITHFRFDKLQIY